MTKKEVISLRNELNKVLEKFNKTSDVKMDLGNAKFGTDVTFQLIGTKLDKNGNKLTKQSVAFEKFTSLHGLKLSALNYEFKHEGKKYKVLGYNSSARKYTIEYEINGEMYKCTPNNMQKIIKKSAPELLFT